MTTNNKAPIVRQLKNERTVKSPAKPGSRKPVDVENAVRRIAKTRIIPFKTSPQPLAGEVRA